MTPRTTIVAGVGLWLMLLCASSPRADEEGDSTTREIESLRVQIAKLEKRLLPPVLLDRASIDAVFGTDASECTWGRGPRDPRAPRETAVRYRLGDKATLGVRYVDGFAADVCLRVAGEVSGGGPGTPPSEILEELRRRHEACLALLEVYRDALPSDGQTLPEGVCRALLAYLADHPDSGLCRKIIEYLPEDRDLDLVPRLIRFGGKDQESFIQRRMRAVAERRPASVGDLIAALGDDAIDEVRKETITDVLLWVSGYGGRAVDSPWFWRVWQRHNRAPDEEVRRERAAWWQEWLARHRDGTRLDWLMEPLAIEKHRSNACVALGDLDDPRAIPILVRLLDDGAREVRLYAANGLLRRKYEGRRYPAVNYPELAQDEKVVMAEAREWARTHGPQADGAAKPAAPADTDKSPR